MRTILTTAAALLLVSCDSAASTGEGQASADSRSNPQGKAQPSAAPAAAGGVADPVAWVRASYDPAVRAPSDEPQGDGRYSAMPIFSPRLRALFAEDEAYAAGEVGRLDFNPFSGASDDDVRGARVTSEDVDGSPGRKVVIARFRNMDADQTITFFWERIGGLWYIDDISGRTAGEPSGWALSLILKYGQRPI
jgi:hypothetical protein